MSSREVVGGLFAKIRRMLSSRARAVCLGLFLVAGAMGGMPIQPEGIEDHMRSMSEAQINQVLEREGLPAEDAPLEDIKIFR